MPKLRSWSTFALTLTLASCCGTDAASRMDCVEDELHEYGVISIEAPEVWGRGRQLPASTREVDWLNTQLADPIMERIQQQSFQGLRDVEIFTSLSASLRGASGIQGMKLEPERADLADQAAEIAGMKNEISLERLRRQLDALQSAPKDGPPPEGSTEAAALPPSGEPTVTLPGAQTDYTPRTTRMSPAQTTTATRTEIERLHDQLAYRDAVHGARREAALDDLADMFGYNVYIMEFDVGVAPGEETVEDYLAEVVLRPVIKRETDEDVAKTLVALVNQHAALDIDHFLRGLKTGRLSWQDLALLRKYLLELRRTIPSTDVANAPSLATSATTLLDATAQDAPAKREEFDKAFKKSLFNVVKPELDAVDTRAREVVALYATLGARVDAAAPIDETSYRPVIIAAVALHYMRLFDGYIEVLCDPSAAPPQTGILAAVSKQSAKTTALKTWLDGQDVYTYALTPREYAQNISDVLAQQDVLHLTAAVSLLYGQAASAELAVNYVRDAQRRVSGILRNPLVVAFGKGQTSCGWLLGPRFSAADDGELRFTRAPYSVTAVVAVPGFVKTLDVDVDTNWVRATGFFPLWPDAVWPHSPRRMWTRKEADALTSSVDTAITTADTPALKRRATALKERLPSTSFSTRVPFDPRLVMRGLADQHHGVRAHLPKVRLVTPDVVPSGATVDLIVRGVDLCSDPQVIVGGVRATDVQAMPDREGLLVRVAAPKEPGWHAISVVTAYGVDTLARGVMVPEPELVASIKLAKGASRSVVIDVPRTVPRVLVQVDPTTIKAAAEMTLVLAPPTGDEIEVVMARDRQDGSVLYSDPLPHEKLPSLPLALRAALRVRDADGRARQADLGVLMAIAAKGDQTTISSTVFADENGARGLTLTLPDDVGLLYPAFDWQRLELALDDHRLPLAVKDAGQGTLGLVDPTMLLKLVTRPDGTVGTAQFRLNKVRVISGSVTIPVNGAGDTITIGRSP